MPRSTPRTRCLAAAGVLLLLACAGGGAEPTGPDGGDRPVAPLANDTLLAFVGVHVVPMDREEVLRDRTVVVRRGRVETIGPASTTDVPPGAAVLAEGADRYLLPGLWDMHVHLDRDDLRAYLDHGITSVRNMWGFDDVRAMQAEVEAGTLLAPTIHSVSPGIDGPPVRWPVTQLITDPARADSMVQVQHDRGWRTLKLYQDLSLEVYDSLVAAARRRGMDYVGHVPSRVPLDHVIASGQRSIEHLGKYQALVDGSILDGLIEATAEAGVWNCPTVAVQETLGSRRVDRLRELVRQLHVAGAGLLVGTDSGIDATRPGASIHRELAHFVEAGLSPYEALRGATADAARFMGLEGEVGTVDVGTRADLLLVRGNPLDDLGSLRDPIGVMVRGRWIPLTPAGG